MIAHRLSTIQNSDAIMVMDHGRIIERGPMKRYWRKKAPIISSILEKSNWIDPAMATA